MRQSFSLFIFLMVSILLPQSSIGQSKSLISTHRIFPKVDKVIEFEKAIAAHAKKYHKGDVSWRVFEIQSGPDFGGYHITEGPTSWTSFDSRGNLGDEHHMDWHKGVAIYLTDRQSAGFSVYQDSLSTIALGDFSDKINITHVYPKPGHGDDVARMIKKLRKMWQANGITVAVYAVTSSGATQYAITTRYKQGLKEREVGFRKPFKELFDMANGDMAYDQYQKDIEAYVESSWSELLFLRKDLSSN
jgi:hypothetical protein